MVLVAQAFRPAPNSRLPDRGSDIPLRRRGVVEVINRHHLPVRPLNRSRIAEVPVGRTGPQNDVVAPGLALIAADSGADAEWLCAVSESDDEATVAQLDEAGRVSSPRVGHGPGDVRPVRSVVVGPIRLDPSPVPHKREDRCRRESYRGRHDREVVALGFRAYHADEAPGAAAVLRARAENTPLTAVRLRSSQKDGELEWALDDVVRTRRDSLLTEIRQLEGTVPGP